MIWVVADVFQLCTEVLGAGPCSKLYFELYFLLLTERAVLPSIFRTKKATTKFESISLTLSISEHTSELEIIVI